MQNAFNIKTNAVNALNNTKERLFSADYNITVGLRTIPKHAENNTDVKIIDRLLWYTYHIVFMYHIAVIYPLTFANILLALYILHHSTLLMHSFFTRWVSYVILLTLADLYHNRYSSFAYLPMYYALVLIFCFGLLLNIALYNRLTLYILHIALYTRLTLYILHNHSTLLMHSFFTRWT